jgi:hypothetical protein
MLSEARRFRRKPLSATAWVDPGPGTTALKCRIEDASDGGARLWLEAPIDSLPMEFRLRFSPLARTGRRCYVVWQRGQSIGVEYLRDED